jgi:4-hydroxy-tetrahydrodipicolinate reductase
MGQAVANGIAAADDLELAGTWTRGGDLAALLHTCDVLVDFTLPEANDEIVAAAVARRVPLVCGVSGLSKAQAARLATAAETIPVVFDRNMSLGIAVLENLVREAARVLGNFAIEIHETHHVHKIDAPSGTALKLGEAIAEERGTDPAEIHYEVERRGEVPGEHEVVLSSSAERLTLGHSVTTRQVFADGALAAARWVSGRSPGLFTMHDVLE